MVSGLSEIDGNPRKRRPPIYTNLSVQQWTLANDFIFLFKKRGGFSHSVFHGTPNVKHVPNVKMFCTQINLHSQVSLTIFLSWKFTMCINILKSLKSPMVKGLPLIQYFLNILEHRCHF